MSVLPSDQTFNAAKGEQRMNDLFKPTSKLHLRIGNFGAFNRYVNSRDYDYSFPSYVKVRGFHITLSAYPIRLGTGNAICLGIGMRCDTNLIGRPAAGDCHQQQRREEQYTFTALFSNVNESICETVKKWDLGFLTDPQNGWYDAKSDTLELEAVITADPPTGVMNLYTSDSIPVNNEIVYINKHQLAMYSTFFQSMFFNNNENAFNEGDGIQIELPADVWHFQRMLETISPICAPLDDECIEGVLHLANQFQVTTVEGECLDFLVKKSKKSALFKYRMADKYGYTVLKKHVLNGLKKEDFDGAMQFMSNHDEVNKLSPGALELLEQRVEALEPDMIPTVYEDLTEERTLVQWPNEII